MIYKTETSRQHTQAQLNVWNSKRDLKLKGKKSLKYQKQVYGQNKDYLSV